MNSRADEHSAHICLDWVLQRKFMAGQRYCTNCPISPLRCRPSRPHFVTRAIGFTCSDLDVYPVSVDCSSKLWVVLWRGRYRTTWDSPGLGKKGCHKKWRPRHTKWEVVKQNKRTTRLSSTAVSELSKRCWGSFVRVIMLSSYRNVTLP